jgi:hypothetical protein
LQSKVRFHNMAQYQKIKTKKSSKKWWLGSLVLLLVVIIAGSFLFWHKHHSKPKVISLSGGQTAVADPNVPGSEDKNTDGTSVTPGTISGPTNSKDYNSNLPGQAASGVQPTKPTGQFISNPGNDSAHPVYLSTNEESSCITTPGAYCEVHFTSGSQVKKSDAHKTDGTGSAIWDWTSQQYHLTRGTWKITMVAINGDKTASSDYALPLTIK